MLGNPALARKKTVMGITGHVFLDGLGDFEHILNAILTLIARMGKEFDFVYQIEISEVNCPGNVYPEKDMQRITVIRDRLIKNGIINPDGDYSGKDFYEIVQKINSQNANIQLFAKSQIGKFQDKFSDHNVILWVVVSQPPFVGERKFTQKEVLVLLEHGGFTNIGGLHHVIKLPIEDLFAMGIGPVKDALYEEDTGKPIEQQGFFLTDIQRTQAMRIDALTKIENPDFNLLLWRHNVPPSAQEAPHLLQRTMIIPTYIQNSGVALRILIAACLSPIAQSYENIIIPCSLTEEEIKDVRLLRTLEKLTMAGFSEIEILTKDKTGKSVIEHIPLHGAGDRKVKFLTKTFFTNADFDNVRLVANDMMLFSGDNTLQDTISYGLLPLVDLPSRKKSVLTTFIEFLKGHPRARSWDDAIKLLERFSEFFGMSVECWDFLSGSSRVANIKLSIWNAPSILDPHLESLGKLMTPAALQQWREICRELVLHHNAHNNIVKLVEDKLQRLAKKQALLVAPLPKPESSASMAAAPGIHYSWDAMDSPPLAVKKRIDLSDVGMAAKEISEKSVSLSRAYNLC
jgi:hypothetical protein